MVQVASYGELPERVFTDGALGMDWNEGGPAGSPLPGSIKFAAVYDYGLVSTQILGLSTTLAGSVGVCAVVQPGTVHNFTVLWGMSLQVCCCHLCFHVQERPSLSRHPAPKSPYHSKQCWNECSCAVAKTNLSYTAATD